MGLSQEELKKINELKNTARFQHSWKAIRNILTWKERVQHYFIRNMLLLFLCFLGGGGLMLLLDEGILPRSDFMNGLMKHLSRLVLFLVVLQILSVLLYSLIGPGWEAKQKAKAPQSLRARNSYTDPTSSVSYSGSRYGTSYLLE